jgi:hypothetical protein
MKKTAQGIKLFFFKKFYLEQKNQLFWEIFGNTFCEFLVCMSPHLFDEMTDPLTYFICQVSRTQALCANPKQKRITNVWKTVQNYFSNYATKDY